ncbi:MAG: hypothetical protein PUD59_04500 [bacterium]|nr:hypothetical protein [bacterium]
MKKELNKKIIKICEEAGTAAAAEKCGELMDELDREYDARVERGMTELEAYREVSRRLDEIKKLVDELPEEETEEEAADRKAGFKNLKRIIGKISSVMWLLTVPVYLVGSMVTGWWKASWLIFLFASVAQTILSAVVDVNNEKKDRRKVLRKCRSSVMWQMTVILYFVLSFATNMWGVTWLIFIAAVIAQVIMGKGKD